LCLSLFLLASVTGHLPREKWTWSAPSDFLAHWTGGRLLLDGDATQLYDIAAQQALQAQTAEDNYSLRGLYYVNPPFAALYFLPFALLPYGLARLLWTALTLLTLAVGARLARSLAPRLGKQQWMSALFVAAVSAPMMALVVSGQDSALSLLLWVAGVRLTVARRDAAAGVVFALGLFKPLLFVLPPLLFLFLWRPRALLGWATTAGVLGAISVLLVGPEGIRGWIMLLASPHFREPVQVETAWRMQSLSALITTWAPTGSGVTGDALGPLLGAPLAGAVAWWALRRRGEVTSVRWGTSGDHEAVLWGLACATTMLVSPHLLDYDLVLLALPALFLLEQRSGRGVHLALLAVFLLTWTAAVRHLLAGPWPWPASLIGASWTAVPLFVLWLQLARLVAKTRHGPSAVDDSPTQLPRPSVSAVSLAATS
jgi:hypothetical protein